jgi:hypothetical protein
MSNLKSIEFEIGTVDDRVAFNINSKVPVEFPVVVTLRVEEALGMITALATAINQTLSGPLVQVVRE